VLDIDANGVNWYQTAYVSGTSNAQWTCIWDQYHGQWQPPGCPAQHSFYLTNQINGNGNVDMYMGGQYAPTQYISFAYGNTSPVLGLTTEDIYTGVRIFCTVAKVLALAYIHYGVKEANTFFAWDGTQTQILPNEIECFVNKQCDNPNQRYAIDGNGVFIWNGSCSSNYNCRGICWKNLITGVWTCPSDLPTGLQPAICSPIPANSHGQCTVHP
jgi:hypothetical protein